MSKPAAPRITLSPDAAARFEAARVAYEAGLSAQAWPVVSALCAEEPRYAGARHLAALCLIDLGAFAEAEAELKAAAGLDRRNPDIHVHLGGLLSRPTRFDEAEQAFRTALGLDPRHGAALAGLGRLLITLGRYPEVLLLTTPVVAGRAPPVEIMELHAEALKHLGRMEEALEASRLAVAAGGVNARLEEPSVLRELGRYEAAEAKARSAREDLGAAPGACIVHGRTLQDLGEHSAAEAAYREALRQAPLDEVAHEHLAELLLGQTGEAEIAFQPLESALAARPTPQLLALKGRLLVRTARIAEAHALLAEAARREPDSIVLLTAAAKTAMMLDDPSPQVMDEALAFADRAYQQAFDLPKVAGVLGEAALAAGRPELAGEIAAKLLRRWPENQAVIALQALSWRMTGDERYHTLYDYDRVVGSYMIEAPRGWSNLDDYLSDLAAALRELHAAPVDAFGMVRRGELKTKHHLTADAGEVFRGFYEAIDAPIRDYVVRLGSGRDWLRRRSQGGYRTKSAWSILTEPNGYQGAHLHSEGWLSSAFYAALPPAVDAGGREGWIRFGEPAIPTRPKLAPEHWIKPDPGRYVLFPSYMWHGTERFTGEGERLIISVDVAPAPLKRR